MSAVIEGQYVPTRHPLSVDDLLRMVEAGIIHDDARIELIEGELIEGDLIDRAPMGHTHAGIVNRLNRNLVRLLGDHAVVSVQNGLELGPLSLPQPDFTVLRPDPQDYMRRLPGVEDVLLVIELSDSTLHYDLRRKLPLYARHGIPEFWVVDVLHEKILRHRRPSGEGYLEADEVTVAAPSLLPQCPLDLLKLFV
jgi:Uma2 family endonuclease